MRRVHLDAEIRPPLNSIKLHCIKLLSSISFMTGHKIIIKFEKTYDGIHPHGSENQLTPLY